MYISEDRKRVLKQENVHTCKTLTVGRVERHVLITAVKRKAEENADAPPMKLIRRELRASDFSNLVDGDLVRVSCI